MQNLTIISNRNKIISLTIHCVTSIVNFVYILIFKVMILLCEKTSNCNHIDIEWFQMYFRIKTNIFLNLKLTVVSFFI